MIYEVSFTVERDCKITDLYRERIRDVILSLCPPNGAIDNIKIKEKHNGKQINTISKETLRS